MALSKTSKDGKCYFILIKHIDDEPNISIGTLWILEQKLTTNLVLVTKYEGDNVGILKQIHTSYLKEIIYQEAHLLLGIPEPLSNRVKVIMDPVWIKEGLEISIGTVVRIFDFPGLKNGALGTVRFRGRLPGKNGTSFGIELSEEHTGKGSTDGTFRHKKLFSCKEDCGVFLSILKIRKAFSDMLSKSNLKESTVDIESRSAAEGCISNKNNFSNRTTSPMQDPVVANDNDCNLNINERVVWMSDEGAEFATVKWVGILPFSADNKIVVGVEFDNAVGTGTGKYKGTQLFKAKRNHASLLPVLGLLKASDYLTSEIEMDCNERDLQEEYHDIKIGGVTTDMSTERSKSIHGKVSTSKLENDLLQLKIDDLNQPRVFEQADGIDIKPKYFPEDTQHHDSTSKQRYKESESAKHRYGARPKVLTNQSPAILTDYSSRGFPDNMKVKDSPSNTNYQNTKRRFETMGEYEQQFFDVKVGSRVRITLGSDRYGTVRWIGTFPDSKTPERIIAGIEMDIEDENCYTNGRFLGEKVFECPSKRGLFYPLNKCVPVIAN